MDATTRELNTHYGTSVDRPEAAATKIARDCLVTKVIGQDIMSLHLKIGVLLSPIQYFLRGEGVEDRTRWVELGICKYRL